MKLLLVILTIFLGKGCDEDTKQNIEAAVIEYTANTRGFYRKVFIENKTVTVSKDREGKDNPPALKISDADWKELIAGFQEVDLEGLPNLKAPTEKRFYDGAAIAELKITYKGKTYQSASFDHGNPPKEIKILVTKINSFVKKSNED